jgi:hypothetical protein
MRAEVCLVIAGCSWASVTQPPAVDPGTRPVPCTESRAAPAADVIGAAAFGAAALAGLAYGLSTYGDTDMEAGPPPSAGFELAVVAAIPATLYLLSAVSGYRSTCRCQRLNHPELGPDPNGFYVRQGIAVSPSLHAGTATRVGPTIGFGYRGVAGAWLIDASVFNVNYWNLFAHQTADFPSAARLGVHRVLEHAPTSSLYVGAAASIGQELIQASDSRYLGLQYRWGPQAEAVVGAQLFEDRGANVFFEASLIAPLEPVVTGNRLSNQDDSLWAPTLQLAMGFVF